MYSAGIIDASGYRNVHARTIGSGQNRNGKVNGAGRCRERSHVTVTDDKGEGGMHLSSQCANVIGSLTFACHCGVIAVAARRHSAGRFVRTVLVVPGSAFPVPGSSGLGRASPFGANFESSIGALGTSN